MHKNSKKHRFAPYNPGFSCKIRVKTPRGIVAVNSNIRILFWYFFISLFYVRKVFLYFPIILKILARLLLINQV